MKSPVNNISFTALALLLCCINSAYANVVVGPLPLGTMCPSGSSGETKKGAIYCAFYDNSVVKAGIGKCDSNVPANMKMQSTVGRNTWCVVRKGPQKK